VACGLVVDAAMAALFALTVVEPMMVSIFGSGFVVVREERSFANARGETIDELVLELAAPPDSGA